MENSHKEKMIGGREEDNMDGDQELAPPLNINDVQDQIEFARSKEANKVVPEKVQVVKDEQGDGAKKEDGGRSLKGRLVISGGVIAVLGAICAAMVAKMRGGRTYATN